MYDNSLAVTERHPAEKTPSSIKKRGGCKRNEVSYASK